MKKFNRKAQQVLSAVMVVILIITVFSVAFMIEPEEVVKKENKLPEVKGFKIVSGMVVLNDILDIAAEQDRELVISAKDGNYYKIRKKGDEWYYSDTTIKVTANNINSEFNYYKISSTPYYIKIMPGAPHCRECVIEEIDNVVTGMIAAGIPSEQPQTQEKGVSEDKPLEVIEYEAQTKHWYTYDRATFRWDNGKLLVTVHGPLWITTKNAEDIVNDLFINPEIRIKARQLLETTQTQPTSPQPTPEEVAEAVPQEGQPIANVPPPIVPTQEPTTPQEVFGITQTEEVTTEPTTPPTQAPPPPPGAEPQTGKTEVPPPPTAEEPAKIKYFVYNEEKREWAAPTETPPPEGDYRIQIAKGDYLVSDGKYHKLVEGGWDTSKDYKDEVIEAIKPSAQKEVIPSMTYEDAKELLQGAELWIDPTTQAEIETKLPQIQADLEIKGLEISKLIAVSNYEEQAVALAQAYQKVEDLENIDTTQFNPDQRKKYAAKLISAYNELLSREKAFSKTAEQAKTSISIYEDATYDSTQAASDLKNPEKKDKAIAFYTLVASGQKEDLARLSKDGALKILEGLKDIDEAQKAAEIIKAENTARLRIEQTVKTGLAQEGELVYKDGQYYYGGQVGDDFYYDPAKGQIVLLQKPKPEQTPEQKAELNQKLLELIPKEERGRYYTDENGNLRNIVDGFVYHLVPTTTGVTLEITGPPKSIFVDGVEIERLENFEIGIEQGMFEGSGVYKGPDNILYDQRGIALKNKEVHTTKKVGAIELKQSLQTDANGKLTSAIAKTQVKFGEVDYDIDLATFNALEESKGEGIKISKPSEDQLKIMIGNTHITFDSYYIKDGKASGYKMVENFEDIYRDKEGKIYTPAQVEKMKEEEKTKLGLTQEKIRTVTNTEFFKEGKLTKLAIVSYGTEIGVAEAVVQDMATGEYEYYYIEREGGEPVLTDFNEDGVPVGDSDTTIVTFNKYGEPDKCVGPACGDDWKNKVGKKANTKQNQFESRRFFAKFKFVMTEFRGLGYFPTLFMKDQLEAWREGVDKAFAQLYLGTEYWVSSICSAKIDRDQKGVAYVDTRTGLAGVAAHIEATRSDVIELPPGYTETVATNETNITMQGNKLYLYKITFNVKNGDWDHDPKALEEMEFNIKLHGEKTSKLLKNDKKLKKGDPPFGRIRANAIVQYSSYYYDKICIKFKEVPAAWSLDNEELCNAIQGPPKEAEKIVKKEGEIGEEEKIDEEILQI